MFSANRENRRRWILNTTLGLIAREGLDAVTIRRVAAELGFSTTSVTYYFSDKAELLLEAFGTFKIQGAHGFRTRYERDPADLLGHLTAITALDEGRLDITRCFHAFRAKALRDGPFRDEERRYSVRCKGYIEAFVKAARPCSADPERAARRLMSIVEGISSQSVIDPGSWSRADIRGEFAAAIDALPHRRG